MRDTREWLWLFACVPLLFCSLRAAETVDSCLKQGRALRAQRKPKEALDAFLSGVALFPDSPELHLEAARAFEELDQTDSAAQHFEDALRLRPDLAPAHVALGILRSEAGRLEEAASHLKSALALDPKSLAAHHALGVVRERQGDLTGALEEYTRAKEIDPKETKARVGLGSVLDKLGKPVEALRELEEAVRLGPTYSPAHYKLSTLCFRLGRKEEGERLQREFRTLKAREHCLRGDRKIQSGDLDGAAREFARALDAEPDHVEAHVRLGVLCLRQGDPARAVEHARRAAELDAKPARFANLSWALHAAGKRDEALEWIDKAIAAEPKRQQFLDQRKAILEAKTAPR